MAVNILGISAFYHDSAAALLVDGEIIAAAQEERFSRRKNDSAFPECAINYVLQQAGIKQEELTAVVFYDKPLLKFERLLETYHSFAPNGVLNFIRSVPIWIKEKVYIKKLIQKKLNLAGITKIPVLFPEHHLSHAASAFYPSPFHEAAILTIDGVGEWATASISEGLGNKIKVLKEMRFPHSLGLFYSAFTYYLGFAVNNGEYKLMGLAPFGDGESMQTRKFKNKILTELVDIREDGSIILNMGYFDFATKLRMVNEKKLSRLLGLPRRTPESDIRQDHMNLAYAVQDITESIVLALAGTAKILTKSKNLVMAGGVALNCTANSKLLRSGLFENIWIQPASGDAGGAIGAAYAGHYIGYNYERKLNHSPDGMHGSYLGPTYSDSETMGILKKYAPCFSYFPEFSDLARLTSKLLAEGNVVGWFQERMEFGPRALGNRSILGDPRNGEMQSIINTKIKFREGFRPFAPTVLLEEVQKYFIPSIPSPYMLFISQVRDEFKIDEPIHIKHMSISDRIKYERSDFPSITHVDYSSRVQTVSKNGNPRFWELINEFKELTGHGMLINTSFNVRDEPIVCSPEDAYLGFMKTDMDYLVIGNYLFDKNKQTKIYTIDDAI